MSSSKKKGLAFVLLFFLISLVSIFVYLDRLDQETIHLTNEEKSWLKKHNNEITITGDPGYFPIDFYENDAHGGYTSDLLIKLEQNLGVTFKYEPSKSWAEALKKAEEGEVEVISCIAATEERLKRLNFTRVFLNIPNYIITHTDNKDIFTDEDLVGKRLAITDNYVSQFYYEEHYPGINIIHSKSDENALQQVSLGEVDATVSDLIGAGYYVSRNSVSNVKVIAQAEFSWRLAFGISNKDKVLTNILNKGIDSISLEDWLELKATWMSYKFDDYRFYKDLIKVLAIITFFGLVVLFISFLWNKKLKEEVRYRTLELNYLKDDLKDKVRTKTVELDRTINDLKRSSKESNRLFSVVSHDLKNSFQGLIGVSGLLKESKDIDNNERQTYLDAIASTSEAMHKLLLNLLDWTSTKTGDLKEEPIEVNLKEIVSEVALQFEVKCLVKKIVVRQEVEDITLKIGVTRFKTILRNLIDNAIKFSPIGSDIFISGALKNNNLVLSIKDKGIGTKENVLENLFSANRHRRRKGTIGEQGTGLGLILCRQCIDQLDGKIEMESDINIGSKFTITIPVIL